MTIFHRQSLIYLSILVSSCGSIGNHVSAFNSISRSQYHIQPTRSLMHLHSLKIIRQQPFVRTATSLKASIDSNTNNDTEEKLTQVLETNNLEKVLSYLQTNPTIIPSLSNTQLELIFNTIELATAESDENTVNKRAIEDFNIESAAAQQIEFQALDKVRTQMTSLYGLLRNYGKLNVFGAIGRSPPPSIQVWPDRGPIYPTSGSKIISPQLLEEITNMSMISLTPQPTNLLLYGGAILAVLEGLISLYYGINFNLLVTITILIALADQLLVSGAFFESILRFVKPETSRRITKHEAGHFLCAYILGCPVEGVVLSTWDALNDGRFGGRASAAVSAGTSYYDLDLSEQIAGVRPLTRESIDRYSIIVMGGIAAEAVEFGRADGGAGDEEALVRFLRSLNPRSKNAVSAWSPDLIRNQARWGATQAVLLLKEYKPCYDALVKALESGADLGQCIVAIEDAATKEGLSWLQKPLGIVLEEGEFGKWVDIDDVTDISSTNENMLPSNGSTVVSNDDTNGVPTYGKESLTDTEEFLKQYKQQMEKKLQSIDEKLQEMDNKSS